MRRLVASTLVLAGILVCGCRSTPSVRPPQVPPAVATASAEGARVALVREALIEAGAAAEGPQHSDGAQSAVRVWRGADGGDG